MKRRSQHDTQIHRGGGRQTIARRSGMMADAAPQYVAGGLARAKALSPERRAEIAKIASDARWARYRACKDEKDAQ